MENRRYVEDGGGGVVTVTTCHVGCYFAFHRIYHILLLC